uniref:Uncharacterized protein n=1 Tax=Anopheles stephensi TaxID=30069 RepID=A0A182YSJ0_ANOST
MPVANMSRYLPIRIYDYYAPERFNETIFDSLQTYLLNICEVCGSSQCPYCSIYNPCRPLPGLDHSDAADQRVAGGTPLPNS